jgi:hypothetical protein
VDYIIVVNGQSHIVFPPCVRVICRPNRGYDFGAHKNAIDAVVQDGLWESYDFFVFMNASVMGPIEEIDSEYCWIDKFYNEFTGSTAPDVALLGTTIVCLPRTDKGGEGPRIEGFFWCTDTRGLSLILDEKTILQDHPTKYSAIVHGEYGLSRCILGHNLNIACMLPRYRGLDWRDKKNWHFNDHRHPSRHGSYYGSSIDPYDVIFHKWYWKGLPKVNFNKVVSHLRAKLQNIINQRMDNILKKVDFPESYQDTDSLFSVP